MLNLMSFSPSNFGRYVSQTENFMDESIDNNEENQTTTNNIPSLMSLKITLPPMSTNNQEKSTEHTSVIKENIEPLVVPQHGPGPIQRPNKLQCSPTTQTSKFFIDPTQTPNTPDVLVQINHLLDHQNSITTIPSIINNSNSINSSSIINDIPTPNIPWTPFSPSTEWTTKYDSSWPIATIQNSNIPFAQRQISTDDSSVWPSVLENTTAHSTSTNDTTKSMGDSWLKFLPISDSPSIDNLTPNKQENETNNSLWNSINLNEMQQNSSTTWWTKPSSDENNNNKNNNNNNNNNNNDQSRWDFAR